MAEGKRKVPRNRTERMKQKLKSSAEHPELTEEEQEARLVDYLNKQDKAVKALLKEKGLTKESSDSNYAREVLLGEGVSQFMPEDVVQPENSLTRLTILLGEVPDTAKTRSTGARHSRNSDMRGVRDVPSYLQGMLTHRRGNPERQQRSTIDSISSMRSQRSFVPAVCAWCENPDTSPEFFLPKEFGKTKVGWWCSWECVKGWSHVCSSKKDMWTIDLLIDRCAGYEVTPRPRVKEVKTKPWPELKAQVEEMRKEAAPIPSRIHVPKRKVLPPAPKYQSSYLDGMGKGKKYILKHLAAAKPRVYKNKTEFQVREQEIKKAKKERKDNEATWNKVKNKGYDFILQNLKRECAITERVLTRVSETKALDVWEDKWWSYALGENSIMLDSRKAAEEESFKEAPTDDVNPEEKAMDLLLSSDYTSFVKAEALTAENNDAGEAPAEGTGEQAEGDDEETVVRGADGGEAGDGVDGGAEPAEENGGDEAQGQDSEGRPDEDAAEATTLTEQAADPDE